uniref:Large ribosomal subunit protein bL35c n=1 Tax=Yamadaella caenomyce TaxID=259029 RepID=A0A1G4NYU0_9FLOR|nr:Ribosomal protein L35 [Yamadaella caenomyce]SCW23817.1 Ribosomal protein L35 [Yamadaella caenomyce]
MPKLKTSASIAKRFKLSGNNKLIRRKAGKSHLLQKKSPARKCRLSRPTNVYPGDTKTIIQKYNA